MNRFVCRQFANFLGEDQGATAVEYAVMLALIIVAAVGAILNTGNVQQELYFSTSNSVEAAVSSGPQL